MWLTAALIAGAVILVAWAQVLPAVRCRAPAEGLSVCLVVRDQAEQLEGLIAEMLNLAGELGPRVTEVVIVDAGSHDGSDRLLELLSRRFDGIRVVRGGPEQDALELALAACSGPLVLLRAPQPAVPDPGLTTPAQAGSNSGPP